MEFESCRLKRPLLSLTPSKTQPWQLEIADPVPDANTIWTFREHLTKTGAIQEPFDRFDGALREAGNLELMGNTQWLDVHDPDLWRRVQECL